MRFESVTAHAFGPFRDETLELAPGMNVIHGPNEAGKSTWHAALYAGLCGVRRARGQPRREDREFAERHRPWDSEGWEVGAVITLADGRHIELRHDLAGRVDSSARDADMAGRDYSHEIMNEGSPDGSRWLGLDRRSFLSTVCVRQAQILAVRDGAGDLQDELQRAADTAGTDETAADALRRLRDFLAERVGTERAWTRPLARSRSAVIKARQQLERAQTAHEEYLERRGDVERLEGQATKCAREADAVRTVLAEAAASRAKRRLERARELAARFPKGPPPRPSEEDSLTQQVAAALTLRRERPAPRQPEGETIPELERQLAELDLQLAVIAGVDASRAEGRFKRARELSAQFPEGRLRLPSEDDALTRQVEAALTKWNDRPEAYEPAGEPDWALAERIEEIDRQLAEVEAQQRGAGGGGGLAGLLRAILIGLARLWRALTRRGEPAAASPFTTPEALRERRARLRNQIDVRIEDERRARGIAEQREQAGDAIQRAAVATGSSAAAREDQVRALREWQMNRKSELAEADRERGDWDALQQLLGRQTLDDVATETDRMRAEADARTGTADSAALAEALEQPPTGEALEALRSRATPEGQARIEYLIESRLAAEHAYARDTKLHDEAKAAIRNAARAVDSNASEPGVQAAALERWQERRQGEMAEADRQLNDWEELQRLLGEQPLEDLEVETGRLRDEARECAAGLDASVITAARDGAPDEDRLRVLEQQAVRARSDLDTARGELAEFEQGLPSVADAEEMLATAQTECDRVEQLGRTLGTTIELLERAEERVHRDIAPMLRGTVREWLAHVTGGRYTDCRVDPQSLAVELLEAGGRWRQAGLLSHGTAEQVYLLLRLALARHLVTPGEVCPFVLDDAVAASDAGRTLEVLDTLLAISESAQVLLFTHEDDVREWAHGRLSGARDCLIVLSRDDIPI